MKFEFTEQELQYILNCVGQRPFAEVEGLVNNIRKQYTELNSTVKTEEVSVVG